MLYPVLRLTTALACSVLLQFATQGHAQQAPFQHASWIAPPAADPEQTPPRFFKSFGVDGDVERATLRIAGLGDYHPRINGVPLTRTGINQAWSNYEDRIYYREFDVTDRIRSGRNTLGVQLTNSFWHNQKPAGDRYYKGGPQRREDEPHLLLAELSIETADGRVTIVATDDTWKHLTGPITFSHIFAGEDYDSRVVQPDWDARNAQHDDAPAARVAESPAGALTLQEFPTVEPFEVFEPDSVHQKADGSWVYVFPQNCSAQLRGRLTDGQSGDTVTFRCGEHGNAERGVFGHYVVESRVTTDGGQADFGWSSFYLGMQYVEVRGAVPVGEPNPDGLPVIEALELVHVRSSSPQVGDFQCSSDIYNGTHRIIDWAMRSNAMHAMTDCPHREKLGWLEQAYLMAPSFLCRYECGEWFEKIEQDIRDAQLESGRVLTVAPSYPAGRFSGAFDWTVEWGAAVVLLPWEHYRWTGDVSVLAANYDSMRRFVDHIGDEAVDGLAPEGLGDWYDYGHGQPPGPSRYTPTKLSSTATWALCASRVADAARALGDEQAERKYRDLHQTISESFREAFLDPSSGTLTHNGSPQCANAMAIYAQVVPESDRDALVEEIIADLEQRDWQQTPGDIGHLYLIRVLAEAGESDALHRIYSRDGIGSYGGVLKKGLTSMPETWDATQDGYQSLNHCMLGHVMEWLYGYVAGIRQAPDSIGWNKVLIAPEPGPLESASGQVQTPHGRITCNWQTSSGELRIEAVVPDGVEAAAVLPTGETRPLSAGKNVLTAPLDAEQADR